MRVRYSTRIGDRESVDKFVESALNLLLNVEVKPHQLGEGYYYTVTVWDEGSPVGPQPSPETTEAE